MLRFDFLDGVCKWYHTNYIIRTRIYVCYFEPFLPPYHVTKIGYMQNDSN